MKRLSISLILLWAMTLISFLYAENMKTIVNSSSFDLKGLNSVDKIILKGYFKVNLIQGDAADLVVQAPESYQSGLKMKIQKNTFYLEVNEEKLKPNFKSTPKFIVNLTLRELRDITLEGVFELETTNQFAGELLMIDMQGVGTTNFNKLNYKKVMASFQGAAHMSLSGKADSAVLDMQGVGWLNAENLLCHQVKASNEGIGKIDLYADQFLTASQEGIGAIKYKGNPKKISKTVEGLGSISESD